MADVSDVQDECKQDDALARWDAATPWLPMHPGESSRGYQDLVATKLFGL